MLIKKIHLRNIRSYENAEIEFSEGSTVLAGDIGAGKTSILLAIEFALFGLQPGQRGSSLLRNGENEGSVSLELEIDNQNLIIERGLKRGKSINQSFAKIEVDGEKKEMSITELKNKVLSLLNYPKEFAKKTNILYRFTVYTPQEEMKQIILETPETRLNTLRHIFGIDKYKKIRENSQFFTAKLRESIRNYEGQIKDLEDRRRKLQDKKSSVKETDAKIELLEREFNEKQEIKLKAEVEVKEVEEKIKEKEKYEKEAEKTNIMLLGKKELTAGIEKEKKEILNQIEDAKQTTFDIKQLEGINAEIKTREEELENKNKSYLDILSKINSLNSKVSDTEKLKEQISTLDLCPTCLQNVNEDYKKNISRKFDEDIAKFGKETNNIVSEKEFIIKQIEEIKGKLIVFRKQAEELNFIKIKLDNLKEKENKVLELEKQKQTAENDVSLLEKQIANLKESAFILKKYEGIYENKKKALEETKLSERGKEIELASIKKEKEMTLVLIQEIEKEIKEKEIIKEKLSRITELEDWLSSSFLSLISFTEKNIMLKLREDFSKLFNEWFNILVPEIFTVHLDEDLTPIIEQQDYQLDYSFLSGGERTAVALAYRLALNQVINSLLSKIKTRDIVILDEPTDGFSSEQLDKMRDVLQELSVNQLIIVSHEPKIESFVESIIKFKKQDGITRIER